MKPISEFIVEIPNSHNDIVKLKGTDIELKVDVKFNQGDYTNRVGTIVAVPMKFKTHLKEGYLVMIDKNLVTFQVHSDTLINKSMFLVDEEKGWYRVPPEMIYMYKQSAECEWQCPAPYAFIEPIKNKEIQTKGGLVHKALNGYKGFKEQYGIVRYMNNALKEQGLNIGDTVFYKKDREYEFKVNGVLLYHMDNGDILAKL